MGLFDFLHRKKRIKGSIGYFGLQEWWLSAFSDEERRYIQDTFQPLGASGDSLTCGDVSYTSDTAVGLLCALAGWFSKDGDRAIAYKLLEKAEEVSTPDTRILDIHFLYGEKLKFYYKDREKPGYLEKAVAACNQQIQLAPKAATAFKTQYKGAPLPSHKGYEQLAVVLEKQKHFREAIQLCAEAGKQGWAGDWQKRIERCKKKLEKA